MIYQFLDVIYVVIQHLWNNIYNKFFPIEKRSCHVRLKMTKIVYKFDFQITCSEVEHFNK